jgi:signal transduction histidine kinase
MVMNWGLRRALIQWFMAVAALCPVGSEAGVLSAAQTKYASEVADVAILKDPTGALAVEDLERTDFAAQFVQLNRPPQLGYSKDVVWLRLRLQRQEDAPQTWFLELSNPFINDLRLYSRAAAGYTVAQAGDQFAFADRMLKFRFPVFALEFPDSRMQTFYLRLDSDSSLAGELVVWQPDALRDKTQHELFYFGVVLGTIVMSCMISIIHGLHTRERKVLLFALLTFNTLWMVATGLGLVAEFLTPAMPAFADLSVPWSLACNTFLVGLVFGRALNIGADFPRMSRFLKLAYCIALAAPCTRWINMYNVWGGPMLQTISLMVVLSTGWLSWMRWRSQALGAGYFFAAHVVVIGSMLMGRLILMGWVPATPFFQLSWLPGLTIYIFLVHAGIFVDSQSVKRERDTALAEITTAHKVLASERKLRDEQTVYFSFVAHELRSPLAAIMTGAKNLESELQAVQSAALTRTRRIKAYAEGLGSLIDRHLTLQRLANADFLPQFSQVATLSIAQEVLRRVRVLFEDREFTFTCAQGVPASASLDQDLLLMALENLLTNAAKFSPVGSPIALDVFADTALRFRVSDRGPGIQAEQTERLFLIFNRMQRPDFKGGFGIGLAIARRVAQVHGGTLEYADRVGGGAVFTLSLPVIRYSGGSV